LWPLLLLLLPLLWRSKEDLQRLLVLTLPHPMLLLSIAQGWQATAGTR
jgi:hypothetical protein